MSLNMKTLLLPLFLIVCLMGDTITRAITARTASDFAMRAFASASHPQRKLSQQDATHFGYRKNTI